MSHPATVDDDDFEWIVVAAVRQILVSTTPTRYLAWARTRLPERLAPLDAGLDRLERRRLASLLAIAIWNATPQPAHGFRPQPLLLEPEASCPCGSGASYGDCCQQLGELPEFSTLLIWEILLDELPEPVLRLALDQTAVPRSLYAHIAERWLDDGHPVRAVSLLEPLFAGPLDRLDADDAPASEILCDAYDELGHARRKEALLARLCASDSQPLRAVAWRRRAGMALGAGEFRRAETALEAARHGAPDDPGLAELEIMLRVAQCRDGLAGARARFWLQRFRRLDWDRADELMAFLEHAVEEPRQALMARHAEFIDPLLLDLYDWIELIGTRALPGHRPYALARPAPDIHGPECPVRLEPPLAVRRIEREWRGHFTGGKPPGNRLALDPERDPWEDPRWLDQLLGYPETADSLEVLDDLLTALHDHPQGQLPWIVQILQRPLLERAAAILERALPAASPWYLPWSEPANRPALRLLFRYASCADAADRLDVATAGLERLLHFDPADPYGVRPALMNHYLRVGADERALELAGSVPGDPPAELIYGEVLALYRLGRHDRARVALDTAMRRQPRIPHYLTRQRVRRPGSGDPEPTPGGEVQAWRYRQAMRDVWAAEPGILDWLKRLTA